MLDFPTILVLGVLMGLALLAGLLGRYFRLPKVTSYILVGALAGWLVPLYWGSYSENFAHSLHNLQPITQLAIALVLFSLGCHFPLARLRRVFRPLLRISASEILATSLLVGLGLLCLGVPWEITILLATLAIATAPATTILVLQEVESEGTVTEHARLLVATNNIACILLFGMGLLVVFWDSGVFKEHPMMVFGYFLLDIGISLLAGFFAGLTITCFYPMFAAKQRLSFLVAAVIILLGLCLHLEMHYLFVFLAMGVTVTNTSSDTANILAELERLTGLLCIIFFVIHGAELDVMKLGTIGIAGIGYLVFRSIGKYGGTWLATRSLGEDPLVVKNLGLTLFAQAGAAISLISIALTRTRELGAPPELIDMVEQVQMIILGTVVIFEIIGPLLIRYAVINSAEVPLANAVYHPGTSLREQLRSILSLFRVALGSDPLRNKDPEGVTAAELMRKNCKTINLAATFDEIVDTIEHTQDNSFPVLNEQGVLMGVIHYQELSSAMFDPALGSLVRAIDLLSPPGKTLTPETSALEISQIFTGRKDDIIPVVDPETEMFVGVVRRRDLFRIQNR